MNDIQREIRIIYNYCLYINNFINNIQDLKRFLVLVEKHYYIVNDLIKKLEKDVESTNE